MDTYRKYRKFRGVINFMVLIDATIPQNLILGQVYGILQIVQGGKVLWFSRIDWYRETFPVK